MFLLLFLSVLRHSLEATVSSVRMVSGATPAIFRFRAPPQSLPLYVRPVAQTGHDRFLPHVLQIVRGHTVI